MATYTQMVDKVLAWSNRDIEVLPYATVKDFINFAADDAYRKLRVPPLEHTEVYAEATVDDADTNELFVPSDLIEIIQLRRVSPNSLTDYQVYDAKSDVRSFYDQTLCKYGYYYYTRVTNRDASGRSQDVFLVHPDINEGEQFELYYYRRLPEADARFNVTTGTSAVYYTGTSKSDLMTTVQTAETSDVFQKDPDLENTITVVDGQYRLGHLVPNWLRDDNEKLLLYGALAQAFLYLDEMESAQKYMAAFNQEIEELNMEDKMRMSRGGNVQQHFTAYGQI